MRRLQYILGAIIFFVIGVFVGWGLPRASVAPALTNQISGSQVERRASIMFDEGDGAIKTFENEFFSENETVFDLTSRIAARQGMGMQSSRSGQFVLINSIDNKIGGAEGKYWLVWVNNHMSEVSSDQYRLKPGDVVEWKFVNLKF